MHNTTIFFRTLSNFAGVVSCDVGEVDSRLTGTDPLRFSSHSRSGLPVRMLMIEDNPNHRITFFKDLNEFDPWDVILYVLHDSLNL